MYCKLSSRVASAVLVSSEHEKDPSCGVTVLSRIQEKGGGGEKQA